jgi:hypothetical protein
MTYNRPARACADRERRLADGATLSCPGGLLRGYARPGRCSVVYFIRTAPDSFEMEISAGFWSKIRRIGSALVRREGDEGSALVTKCGRVAAQAIALSDAAPIRLRPPAFDKRPRRSQAARQAIQYPRYNHRGFVSPQIAVAQSPWPIPEPRGSRFQVSATRGAALTRSFLHSEAVRPPPQAARARTPV